MDFSAATASTQRIMLVVAVALLPGIATQVYFLGLGVLWNLAWLSLFCYATEIGIQLLRKTPTQLETSTLVTALLIGICLPPSLSLDILAIASLAAVGLAKHAYGGLGNNVFNPAMVGYAVVLVSFPEALSHWPSVSATNEVDSYTGATILSQFRYREGMTAAEFMVGFEAAWEMGMYTGIAFLLGGAGLVFIKVIHWRLPVAASIGLALGAIVGYDQGSSESAGGLLFHLFSGGFIAAAFFVLTDPITHPRGARMQWLFGIGIGLLIYVLRAGSAYPDGIAFAVLLGNACVPLANRYYVKSLVAKS